MNNYTDRELIELAALAAGIDCDWNENFGKSGMMMIRNPQTYRLCFDPINDDGDALRLCVKLGFGISFGQYAPLDVYSVYVSEIEGGDTLAVGCIVDENETSVVRRAITQAAAVIGTTK